MKNIVVYGIGDFAKTLTSYIEDESAFNIEAYVVDEQYISNGEVLFNGKKLLSLEKFQQSDSYKSTGIILAVGYANMRARAAMFSKALATGRELVNFISKQSVTHKGVIFLGGGNIVFPGTVIEANTKIGDNNIFWSSVNISHDVQVGSHCFFASQSLVGGFSQVKDNCFLGFNSTVLQNITVEKETLVGACSLVNKNTESYGKYIGQPAKLVSFHENEGIKIK